MTEITDYIRNDFRPIDSKETIEKVLDFFSEVNYSHFPVTEEGTYIGSIAAEDCETFELHKKVGDFKYTLEGFFARNTMIWLDILEIFAQNQSNIVSVLNEKNQYIGYYELEEVMQFFQQTPFIREQGGIIIVEKSILDYSMSQITQIVESNNGRLLGVFISQATTEKVQITIKIALGGLSEIIQTFRRYNYEIISEHAEDTYLNSLKERSDYLDKYLNM
jgi:Mg/Co/Ni transporter MgtE